MNKHPFERHLSVALEDSEWSLSAHEPLAWSDFLLNPRRLRGSDFLMRWSQGVWSEERLVQAVNATSIYFALPYGPSGVAPSNDVRAFELYFERLEAAGLGKLKRPDLLIFRQANKPAVEGILSTIGGVTELPFVPEEAPLMQELLSLALIAVECENSLWLAQQMPDYNAKLTPQKRLGKLLGLRKTAVLPTVIIKEEDRTPLRQWQNQQRVSIHIWHVFFDLAFGLTLDEADRLVAQGNIQPTVQIFQAPGGATSKKNIYKFYYHYAYKLGRSIEMPQLSAQVITDKNGHILPYVRFEGGRLELEPEALDLLEQLAEQQE